MTYIELSIKLKGLGFKSIRPNLLMFPCKQSFDMWNEFFNCNVCIVSKKMLEFPILLLMIVGKVLILKNLLKEIKLIMMCLVFMLSFIVILSGVGYFIFFNDKE